MTYTSLCPTSSLATNKQVQVTKILSSSQVNQIFSLRNVSLQRVTNTNDIRDPKLPPKGLKSSAILYQINMLFHHHLMFHKIVSQTLNLSSSNPLENNNNNHQNHIFLDIMRIWVPCGLMRQLLHSSQQSGNLSCKHNRQEAQSNVAT